MYGWLWFPGHCRLKSMVYDRQFCRIWISTIAKVSIPTQLSLRHDTKKRHLSSPLRHPMCYTARHPARHPGSAKGKTWAATNGPRCLGAIACATSPRSWAFARACRTWKAVAGCLGAKGCHGMPGGMPGLEDPWDFLKEETTETTWNNQRYPKVSKGHFNIKTCKKLNKHIGIYVQVIGMYHMSVEPRSRE